MRKSRFTEAQIVSILKEHDAASFIELGRRHGVHPNPISAWKAKYGGMESSEIARARAMDDENARLRRIVANLTLENDAMRQLIEKLLGPSRRKEAVTALQEFGLSQRAACRISGCPRSVAQYKMRRTDEPRLVERIKAIAMERRRFGYRRIGLMLRRDGIVANHKRVYRIYRDLGPQLRPRRKRGVRYVRGNEVPPVTRPNETVVARLRSRSALDWTKVSLPYDHRRLHARMHRHRNRFLFSKPSRCDNVRTHCRTTSVADNS